MISPTVFFMIVAGVVVLIVVLAWAFWSRGKEIRVLEGQRDAWRKRVEEERRDIAHHIDEVNEKLNLLEGAGREHAKLQEKLADSETVREGNLAACLECRKEKKELEAKLAAAEESRRQQPVIRLRSQKSQGKRGKHRVLAERAADGYCVLLSPGGFTSADEALRIADQIAASRFEVVGGD